MTAIEILSLVALLGIVATMAAPALFRASVARNEDFAIAALRAIAAAEKAYSASCSAGGPAYAPSLDMLRRSVPPPSTAAASPAAHGYRFSIEPAAGARAANAPNCPGAQTSFYAIAEPIAPGRTGARAFAASEDGVVWQDTAGIPPAEPFASVGTTSPVKQ